MANKLTTLGYFLKRLRDSGYYACKIFTDYGSHDPRAWTIVLDPKGLSVHCTCFINDPFLGESYFELYDGNQYLPGKLKIKTSSFEVLIEHLIKHCIYPTTKTKQ
jgi:hypothetical protein